MIDVCCSTDWDDCKNEEWPTQMVVRPVIGDMVRSKSGKILTIVEITHATTFGEATLHIELDRRTFV